MAKTYDALMRITSLNNGIKSYTYSYDDVSNIVSDSYKNYTFDDVYRLTEVNESLSGTLLENFSYDKVGNRINSFNTNIGSGANYEYSANNLNQYTTLSGSISRYMIEEIIEEVQNIQSEDVVLGEESLNEEETENGSGETLGENESFDKTGSGNILDEENIGSGEIIENQEIVEEIPETIQNITYSGGLVNIDDSKTFVYDNNGNIVSNGSYNFIYDYKNRIIEVNNGSGIIAEFTYDVLDRRYLKETGSKTISYVFAGENILGETTLDGVNSIQKDYINGLGTDNLVAYELDNVRYYFHKNHLGSIDGITDNSGDLVIEYAYDSFGNTYVVESGELIDISDYSGDTFQNERLYTGREFDFEVGLYYNRARYYSPELGRFISRDPIDIKDDINLYAYVGNNPVMFVDLMGTEKLFAMKHDVTELILDKFNKGGITLEDLKTNKGTFGVLKYMGNNIGSNIEDYNIKFNSNLLEKSIKDLNGNPTGYVYVGGVQTHLSEVGNLLYGYVGEKGGLAFNTIDISAYIVNLEKEKERSGGFLKDNFIINNYYNEREDRQLYYAGYELSKNTVTGQLTEEKLIEYLKYGQNLSNKANSLPIFGEYFQ